MTEADIRSRWATDGPKYEALAAYVAKTISDRLAESLNVGNFLKLPPQHRAKDVRSLIEKALYRRKKYTDPYGDITDKAGVRFVVLTSADIEILRNTLKKVPAWTARLARDYRCEQKKRPESFDYASVHYILTLRKAVEFEGEHIPGGLKCEVQLRSLLQHACSELTHDSIYKAAKEVTPSVKRVCAKVIALSEVTDDFFLKTYEELAELNKDKDEFLAQLDTLYERYLGASPQNTRLRDTIFNALGQRPDDAVLTWIRQFLERESPWLAEDVGKRRTSSILHGDSIILLIYYMLMRRSSTLLANWPLRGDELALCARDLGVDIEN